VNVYNKNDPNKVNKVIDILNKYHGREIELIQKIVRKYKIPQNNVPYKLKKYTRDIPRKQNSSIAVKTVSKKSKDKEKADDWRKKAKFWTEPKRIHELRKGTDFSSESSNYWTELSIEDDFKAKRSPDGIRHFLGDDIEADDVEELDVTESDIVGGVVGRRNPVETPTEEEIIFGKRKSEQNMEVEHKTPEREIPTKNSKNNKDNSNNDTEKEIDENKENEKLPEPAPFDFNEQEPAACKCIVM